jgi:HIP---CoA ligase
MPDVDKTMCNDEISAAETVFPWPTIPAMLADNLLRHAQRPALVDGATRLSYAELHQRMLEVAAGLHARNLGPGDVVAIWAPNCWQWVVGAAACWWRGCILTPIPAKGKILDALPILQATRAKLLFTSSSPAHGDLPALIANHLSDTGNDLRHLCPSLDTIVDFSEGLSQAALDVVTLADFTGNGRASAVAAAAHVAGADMCEILFTSGSTGRPKGVPRSHEQVLRNRRVTCREHGYSQDDCLLVIGEFSHTLGLNGNLLRCLMLGARLVITHSRNPAELAQLIRAEHVTSIGAPPSLFSGLLRERMGDKSACSELRLGFTGTAHIPPALVRDMIAAGIDNVISGYGMTECDTISSTALSSNPDVIATTVGRPQAGMDVQITDESGAPVPPGVEGELWIRGYAVSSSYLGVDGQIEAAIDAQGWLHSGDVGCFTAEGNLRILGRKKDVIIIHGYTLYPAEIETLLMQSGMLKDVAAIGIPHAVAGEQCVAFVVPADPTAFSLKRLRLWARDNVTHYKVPGRFIVVDRMPLNRNGKVDRSSLRNSLEA